MPELPEVETLVRSLEPGLTGRTVSAVKVYWQRSIATPQLSLAKFSAELRGAKFLRCSRRAKYLHFTLSNNREFIVHLRMSGDLLICKKNSVDEKHLRLKISLDNGKELCFVDPRKFGRVYLVNDETDVFSKLGIEPLSDQFTVELFESLLQKTKRPIKTALLDQSIIAGIGNIYAVESLWHAQINPLKPANSIATRKLQELHAAIRKVLKKAIASGGTDIGDGVWKKGGFSTFAYGRVGNPCRRCKIPIKRIIVAQRGTEFCPKCQR
jgi:formamidopyrimidine-DNA glycosylase